MVIKIGKKDYELKFTFNSFNYMQEFDLTALNDIETKPFKMIPVVTMLLMGAVNNSPKNTVSTDDVYTFLEEYIKENSLAELLETLIGLLEDSDFFKSLQKTE